MAPGSIHLPLLPSGPDGVRGLPPHETQPAESIAGSKGNPTPSPGLWEAGASAFFAGEPHRRGETGNHAYNMVLEGIASAGPAARANNHKSFRVAACMISTRFETTTPSLFSDGGSVLAFARHAVGGMTGNNGSRGRTWGGDTKTRGFYGRDRSRPVSNLRTPFHRSEAFPRSSVGIAGMTGKGGVIWASPFRAQWGYNGFFKHLIARPKAVYFALHQERPPDACLIPR